MNKTLLIELKDKTTNVTLVSADENNWNVIFSQNYEFNTTDNNAFNYFDITWIKKMKHELSNVIDINRIDNISLLLNVSCLELNSDIVKNDITESLSEIKTKLKNQIQVANPTKVVTTFTINKSVDRSNKRIVYFTYETIERNILQKIQSLFKGEGINVEINVPLNKAIFNGIKPVLTEEKDTYYVEVDDEQMILSFFKKGKPIYQRKLLYGLKNVYKNIMTKMDVTYFEAKKLFNLFGSIPPEAIKDKDNRIIYSKKDPITRAIHTFDKRDLSTYITESVNSIFSVIFKDLDLQDIGNTTIYFSGQIIKLKGFIEYSRVTLDKNEIRVFKQEIVGINLEQALLHIGGIKYVLLKTKDDIKFLEKRSKERHLNTERKQKRFKSVIDKITRFYNYI